MKTILNVTHEMTLGGVEQFVMNVYRHLNNDYRIIFLCYKENQYYEKEIRETNSKLYFVPPIRKTGVLKFIKNIIKIIKKEKVDIIHIHTFYNSLFPLIAALFTHVPTRIVHSHSNWQTKSIIKKTYNFICKIGINILASDKLACSKEAGKNLFFKNFEIIPNGIETEKFIYNEKSRNIIRKKYNISEKDILIGHVGRLEPVKNHLFILELLPKLLEYNNNYKIMFVGAGQELENIKELAKKNNIEDKIVLVGNQIEAYMFYNAFDLFLFPSIQEGFGMTLIEAQINGLPIIASNFVPKETNESGSIIFLDLEKNKWLETIIGIKIRRINSNYYKNTKYNIKNTVKILKKIYK